MKGKPVMLTTWLQHEEDARQGGNMLGCAGGAATDDDDDDDDFDFDDFDPVCRAAAHLGHRK